ncbi:MAG: hypothetical protein ACTSUQ_05660 [Candidatus Freyarchaeota archaeon]
MKYLLIPPRFLEPLKETIIQLMAGDCATVTRYETRKLSLETLPSTSKNY